MTKDKFELLCERVLVPKIGDLMHRQLAPLHDTLEMIAAELTRLGRRMERLQDPGSERDQ